MTKTLLEVAVVVTDSRELIVPLSSAKPVCLKAGLAFWSTSCGVCILHVTEVTGGRRLNWGSTVTAMHKP